MISSTKHLPFVFSNRNNLTITSIISNITLPSVPNPKPVFPPLQTNPIYVYDTNLPSLANNWRSAGRAIGTFPIRRIFCIGKNYEAHKREMEGREGNGNGDGLNEGKKEVEEPFFFCKPHDSLIDTSSSIDNVKPHGIKMGKHSINLEYEAELVLFLSTAPVEGKELESIYGVAVASDQTRRDLQHQAKQTRRPWEVSKAFNDSGIIGGVYKIPDDVDRTKYINNLIKNGTITLKLNGETRQNSRLSLMTTSPGDVIKYIQKTIGLERGDCIFTGTPSGVGVLKGGDLVEIDVFCKAEAAGELGFVGGCRFKMLDGE